MSEASGLNRLAREEAAQRARVAKSWEARQAEAERGPEAITCPPGANERQRAAWHSAMHEIVLRERASKVQRGWQRVMKRTSPAGTIPLAALWGQRMAVLCIDLRGVVRLVEDSKVGPAVTVSEAVAIASGR
jgi:hypothetical protein